MAKSKSHKVPTNAEQCADAPATSDVAAWLVRWSLPIVVVALTVAAFFPALQNGFVDWDDDKTILQNLHYRGFEWAQIRWMLTTFYMGHYQPLSWLTLALDYFLWGLDPFGYHLTSLILHGVNALIFYFIAIRLLSLASAGAAEIEIRPAACFAALVFAIHPLRVESVVWVTERRDVLAGLFFLLTILCYLKGAAATAKAPRMRWMASAVIIYGLSLLSKAAGMTLPIVLLALDVYPLRRLGDSAKKWLAPETRKIWLEKIPFFLLALVFGVVALLAQREAGALLLLENYGITKRLAQAFFGVFFYLWKTIVPLSLSPIYALPLHLETSDRLLFVFSVVVDLGITAVLVIHRRRWPALLAAWICYLALLAPVLGFFQAGPQLAADRYTYLSCLGWAMILAGALLRILHARPDRRDNTQIVVAAAIVIAMILLSLGALTWQQTQAWRDPLTLWRHAVRIYPGASKAQNNLANALVHRGRVVEAIEHYRQALRIDPDYKEGHHNLGLTLAGRGEWEEAMREYRQALRIDPRYKEAHNNLAVVLFYQERLEEAIEHYRAAVEIDPGYKVAHNNLGVALGRQNKPAEAIKHFKRALETDPDYKDAHYNLANALADRGDTAQAIEHYRAALRIDPGYEEARNNLSVLLEGQRKK